MILSAKTRLDKYKAMAEVEPEKRATAEQILVSSFGGHGLARNIPSSSSAQIPPYENTTSRYPGSKYLASGHTDPNVRAKDPIQAGYRSTQRPAQVFTYTTRPAQVPTNGQYGHYGGPTAALPDPRTAPVPLQNYINILPKASMLDVGWGHSNGQYQRGKNAPRDTGRACKPTGRSTHDTYPETYQSIPVREHTRKKINDHQNISPDVHSRIHFCSRNINAETSGESRVKHHSRKREPPPTAYRRPR